MYKLEEARKQIGKEFKVSPHELGKFKDGKCKLTVREHSDVVWYIHIQLLSKDKMKITDITRESIIKVV